MPPSSPSPAESNPPVRSPKAIAFCITELDPGGAERALVELVTRLDRSEWSPHVACLGPARGPLPRILAEAGIPVTSFGATGAWRIDVLFRLARWLRQVRPVLLQTWLYHANLLGRLAARLAGVRPVVSGIRVAERRSRWRLRLDRWTSPLVRQHVCVSQATAEFSIVQGGLPRERVSVIPNGVDFARFARHAPTDAISPPQSPTVLFVGRLDPQKNPDLFVSCAAEVLRVRPNVQFQLVGEGPLRAELSQRIQQEGLGLQVSLLGQREDVPELMRGASCLVLTSRWEGLPNVVLEAMAAGLPVIATDVEGVRELVTPAETGIIVPDATPAALARPVLDILDDSGAARAMGQAAQTAVQQRFTWDRVADSYAALYDSLLGSQLSQVRHVSGHFSP